MLNLIDIFPGELAALTTALLWAISATVYSILGQTIPPLLLNLYKGVIAIVLILVTLFLGNNIFSAIELKSLVILLISGAIGIGLGDTAYFSTLNYLGPRKTLLLETLAPPMAALLGSLFLGELLSFAPWCGIFLTILGVIWVIGEQTRERITAQQNLFPGINWGLLAAFCQASGAILSRYALVDSNIIPLESALLRLIGGTIFVLFLLLKYQSNYQYFPAQKWSMKLMGVIFLTAFMSTYLGIWLQQTAFKFSPAGIAQTLLATSPLFVIPIAACLGEKISLRSLLGAVISLIGIGILFSAKG